MIVKRLRFGTPKFCELQSNLSYPIELVMSVHLKLSGTFSNTFDGCIGESTARVSEEVQAGPSTNQRIFGPIVNDGFSELNVSNQTLRPTQGDSLGKSSDRVLGEEQPLGSQPVDDCKRRSEANRFHKEETRGHLQLNTRSQQIARGSPE